MSCLRSAPSTLRKRHLAGALAGAGGGEVGEVDAGHAEDERGDDREGDDRPPVVAGRRGAVLGLAEMDVADVDQPLILLVAGIVFAVAEILVGDVALLPGRKLRRGSRSASVPGLSAT